MAQATTAFGAHRREHPRHEAPDRAQSHFYLWLLAIVALGAAIRLAYVWSDDRPFVGGDGFDYSLSGVRLADGLGYTDARGNQTAHHPPGWITTLGILAQLGGRTLLAQQLLGVAIGLGVVAIAAFVGRRFFNARVGLLAATIAAVYPGFWIMEAQVLSEPLGLLIVGVLMLVVIELRDRPTLAWSVVAGATCGLLALVRPEQLALLVVLVAPVLFLAKSIDLPRRFVLFAVAAIAAIVVIAPWTLYNETRFENTVILSTNGGSTLLAGNCPPKTYSGELLGYYDITCNRVLSQQNAGQNLDRSEADPRSRRAAFTNIGDNLDKLPVTVAARLGRTLAVFRPAQTVDLTAAWFRSDTWPVWLWVASFWLLVPLSVMGAIEARRAGAFLLPLLAPALVAVPLIAVAYGEPRYHTPADLGLIVLAAVALDRLISRGRTTARSRASTPARQSKPRRLPRVVLPG
jgi:4-amino-4-deoxy-L-arabinose transferase-like glycosyltransferase